jgi:uncharacterized protein
MLKKILFVFPAVLFVFASVNRLSALEAPALKGRVNDYAEMLSPSTVNRLETRLAEFERTDSTQIAVLTVPSLQGDSLEEFSIRTAEKWKLGQKGADNGALLVISRDDRKLRIEVGYGLEGKLTDLMSGRIIDDIITPDFKQGNFDAGVEHGVEAMIKISSGEFTAKDLPERKKKSLSGKYIFFAFFLFFLIGSAGSKKKIFGGITGAVILPIIGLLFFPFGLWLLFLIPAGFLGGFLIPLFFIASKNHPGGPFGGSGGFFSSGGFGSGGGGGGFSGGGGGFGGGGSSGGW